MSKHTRTRIVYLNKIEPLILDQYELTTPSRQSKFYRPERYWRIYNELKVKFLEKHEQMRRALLEEKFVPPWLHEEYEQAKEALLTAVEIINQDYSKQVV